MSIGKYPTYETKNQGFYAVTNIVKYPTDETKNQGFYGVMSELESIQHMKLRIRGFMVSCQHWKVPNI